VPALLLQCPFIGFGSEEGRLDDRGKPVFATPQRQRELFGSRVDLPFGRRDRIDHQYRCAQLKCGDHRLPRSAAQIADLAVPHRHDQIGPLYHDAASQCHAVRTLDVEGPRLVVTIGSVQRSAEQLGDFRIAICQLEQVRLARHLADRRCPPLDIRVGCSLAPAQRVHVGDRGGASIDRQVQRGAKWKGGDQFPATPQGYLSRDLIDPIDQEAVQARRRKHLGVPGKDRIDICEQVRKRFSDSRPIGAVGRIGRAMPGDPQRQVRQQFHRGYRTHARAIPAPVSPRRPSRRNRRTLASPSRGTSA
jgi:hypothetical protein